jgi:hypothetical protein
MGFSAYITIVESTRASTPEGFLSAKFTRYRPIRPPFWENL